MKPLDFIEKARKISMRMDCDAKYCTNTHDLRALLQEYDK